MKRTWIDPSALGRSPWETLSGVLGLAPCHSAAAFEKAMLQIRRPLVLEAGGRQGYSREVLDTLESIQQKSEFVFVIWARDGLAAADRK